MNRKPWNPRVCVLTLIWTLALVAAPYIPAQLLNVSGTVTDPAGEVLVGVSVSVKGDQKHGIATGFDGDYSLSDVPADATLVFSYVGFSPVEEPVSRRTIIDVTMHEQSELLDEVVVVGYGSLSRKELSSSIVQVNRNDFQKGAMNSHMEMLTGKVAGLNVSSTAAANPNAGASLQVRGATSLSAGNGPLIVIDGVAGGDIRTLAPQDIESMSVLKDAASAAIYGTRGANGVILITTKRGLGDVGHPVVTYDSGKDDQAGTTIARQLALYLTMPSPMQMACDLPENYERFPDAFQFIKDVPVDWSDSRYLEAEPMRYITVARRDKNSDDWYIGAITDENAREAHIDLSFLPKGKKYTATIYEDAPDADWKTNPQAYRIRTTTVSSKTRLRQHLAPGGGTAIRLTPTPQK